MAAPGLPAALDYPRIKLLAIGDVTVGKSCIIKRFCEGRFITKYIPTIGIDFGVKKVDVNQTVVRQRRSSTPVEPLASATTALSSSNVPTAVRVNFWDSSGDDDYCEIRNEFYEAAQGVLLVYDVRNLKSFSNLQKWWDELILYCESLPPAAHEGSSHSPKNADAASGGVGEHRKRSSVNTVTSMTAAGKAVGHTGGKAPIVILCANKVDETSVPGSVARPRAVTEEQGRAWAREHGCAAYYEVSASTEKNIKEMMEEMLVRVVAKFM